MTPNYEKLKHDLMEYGEDAALNLLYRQYQGLEVRDTTAIQIKLAKSNHILEKLPLRDNDAVFYLTAALCDEYEKKGFMGGIRIGAKLMQELNLTE